MSGESILFDVELTDMLWDSTGSLLSGNCVCLLGVKSDVTAISADHIIWG